MNSAYALIVGEYSMQTNTQSKDVVQRLAGSAKFGKIEKIERLPHEPVYNMEVETVHNFSVEGGLIVHNCLDALRYSLQAIEDNKRLRTLNKNILFTR